ncbi:MAG: hypothetical protein JWO36_6951, partial [Myxococcales bacterium]|nr:hypothetical protein [Myxococcales bacterium]
MSDGRRNLALEEPIRNDPYDPEAYLVYADWLQAQGDPRGELIALEVAAEKDRTLTAAANEFFDRHADRFLGPLAEHQSAFTWRFGFIHRVRLTSNRAKVYELVRAHPSGRFLAELFVRPAGLGDRDLEAIVELLVGDAPPSLRRLQLGADRDRDHEANWFHSGTAIERLWAPLRRLRHLVIDGGQYKLGTIDLPEVEYAAFRTGGLVAANARSIAAAHLPRVRHLDVAGDHNNSTETLIARAGRVTMSRDDGVFSDLAPLFERTDLPSLTVLGITNSVFTDTICRALPSSRIVQQLEALDLSWGSMTDAGARALVENRDAFRRLEILDVSRNTLSRRGIEALQHVAKL